MKISLIISTYEQPAALAKVLRGVTRQTRSPDEVFLADDGSGEETHSLIERFKAESAVAVHHLWHPHDGFRKVVLLNQAVAEATGDYLIFTDGDCVPHPRFLADHERLAEPGFWVQGRRCYVREKWVSQFDINRSATWRCLLTRRMGGVAKACWLPYPITFRNQKQRGILGCNMAFWRKDVLAVNGFDETYLGRGISPDSDLGTRVYNLGRLRKFVYGHAIVYHLDHAVAPREQMELKRQWLEETIQSGRVRSARGLDQHQPVES
jgi:glycosyltransferase involved in cell wall biosynthesis